MAIEITAGKYCATIVSDGAGLASLTYAGHDIVLPHYPAEKPVGYNGKVLIPWPNRITNGQYVWRANPSLSKSMSLKRALPFMA